jgi:putative ABC transport system ATP-binding protein
VSNIIMDRFATKLKSQSLIQATDLKKKYVLDENEVWALNGVSVEIEKAGFVALCGSSGSGKSTLLNLLGCLDVPSAGEIVIDGFKVNEMNDRDLSAFRAAKLGFIFQTFNLLPVLSAAENVEYPLLKLKIAKDEREERVQKALTSVGLAKFGDHRPGQLSGGQRQRVAIARAIVHQPELIIADEPTASLDKKTATEVLDLLGQLNRDLGITLVVATHDPLVMNKARRQIFICDGVINENAA